MFQLLVLSSYAFDAGISLMLYQNLINCILVALLSLFGAVTVEKLNWKLIRVWLPVNVIFVGMLVSGMYSLKFINIAMVTILKNMTNILTTIGELYIFRKRQNQQVWAAMFLMVLGFRFSILYMCSLGNKKVELFDSGVGPSEPTAEDNVQMASTMSNQELITAGNKTMDETDQAIERSKQVVHQTVEVGTQTASTLKGQTDQMGRIVNELDTIQFSIKKASQLVKEIGRQVATDKCIMLFLFLIVCGVVAVIVVKVNSF
ncbi:hypothetical protein POM88_043596 [Heracleum sosnowskyi]|uniref:t-SNARE coiled-coil homology domain-containing protein n=1 Tax=Heracleum sosnowskyi TaxID=360622 RepID=A0AAD8H1B3_9APIA|nr:hypothetical protein POM88_043596 [Heracleum sosnowskyi]